MFQNGCQGARVISDTWGLGPKPDVLGPPVRFESGLLKLAIGDSATLGATGMFKKTARLVLLSPGIPRLHRRRSPCPGSISTMTSPALTRRCKHQRDDTSMPNRPHQSPAAFRAFSSISHRPGLQIVFLVSSCRNGDVREVYASIGSPSRGGGYGRLASGGLFGRLVF